MAKSMIRAKGVSCHSLPALRAATVSDWTEVHLVRVNPQAKHIDGVTENWNDSGNDISPVVAELQTMHAKGRGVIGMKIIGNGDFKNPEDRERSIRYAMSRPEIDSVVIGFKSPEEIDEAIRRINLALAEKICDRFGYFLKINPDNINTQIEQAKARALATNQLADFPSVVFAGAASRLADIRATDAAFPLRGTLAAFLLLVGNNLLRAQADLQIYTDSLQNGWANWSWSTTLNFRDTTVVHGGTTAISASITAGWAGLSLHRTDFDSSPYADLVFWINGGPTGGQLLRVYAELGGVEQPGIDLPALAANTWQQVTLSLSQLGVANKPNFIQGHLGQQRSIAR